MSEKISQFPCPICGKKTCIIGATAKDKKIGSCGCTWKFKKTKSEKVIDRKYSKTEWGLELNKEK